MSCTAARMLAEVSLYTTTAVRVTAIRPPARKLLETMRLQALLDEPDPAA